MACDISRRCLLFLKTNHRNFQANEDGNLFLHHRKGICSLLDETWKMKPGFLRIFCSELTTPKLVFCSVSRFSARFFVEVGCLVAQTAPSDEGENGKNEIFGGSRRFCNPKVAIVSRHVFSKPTFITNFSRKPLAKVLRRSRICYGRLEVTESANVCDEATLVGEKGNSPKNIPPTCENEKQTLTKDVRSANVVPTEKVQVLVGFSFCACFWLLAATTTDRVKPCQTRYNP